MPALYTHYRFGKAVEKELPAPLQETLADYPQAFALGTQGPDILFYHKPMKSNPVRSRGVALHAVAPEGFFVRAAKEIVGARKQNNDNLADALTAYVCGFLCHFTLDISCHPYIDEKAYGTFTHGKIESELDKYMLRLDGLPIRGYNTATPLSAENYTVQACADILEVKEEEIQRAIKTIKKINGWFSSKCEPFHALAHVVLTVAGMERKFGDMFLHKKDDTRFDGMGKVLLEKSNAAIEKAAALITEFMDNVDQTAECGALHNETYQYNYSGILAKENTQWKTV